METSIISQLSQELEIAAEFVVREYWEMEIMNELAKSEFGSFFVFKGGTALRLAYNSPRFSEDLDFDLTKKFPFTRFKKFVNDLPNKYGELRIKDLAEKYNTCLAQISIKDAGLERAFSIKIEISTRATRRSGYFEPKLLISPVTSRQVLVNVARLEEIIKEKKTALKTRKQPRDLFDLWYLAQLTRQAWQCPEHSIGRVEIKRELYKFLPRNYYKVINELTL